MVTEMFADERTEKIKALLLDYKRIDINTLISMIPASPATVRRDLEKMEKEVFLRRTHGGVCLWRRRNRRRLCRSTGICWKRSRSARSPSR